MRKEEADKGTETRRRCVRDESWQERTTALAIADRASGGCLLFVHTGERCKQVEVAGITEEAGVRRCLRNCHVLNAEYLRYLNLASTVYVIRNPSLHSQSLERCQ